jgi:hypothetical protein
VPTRRVPEPGDWGLEEGPGAQFFLKISLDIKIRHDIIKLFVIILNIFTKYFSMIGRRKEDLKMTYRLKTGIALLGIGACGKGAGGIYGTGQ